MYCVIVQSYVATENRLQQDANFFQDLCNNITNNNDNKEGKNGLTEYNLLPFFLFSYKWNVSDVYLSKSSVEGRTFNEHPLEDQPSVPVEKSDNKVKGRMIFCHREAQYYSIMKILYQMYLNLLHRSKDKRQRTHKAH